MKFLKIWIKLLLTFYIMDFINKAIKKALIKKTKKQ
jgi:hypothetical protein